MNIRNYNFVKNASIIMAISLFILSFEGCNDNDPVNQEPIDEDIQEVIIDDNVEPEEISSDIESQLKIISDN